MPRKIDLTGMKFGKLIVLDESQYRAGRDIEWWCQCECGRISRVIGNNLRRKHTTSCGKCSLNKFYKKNDYMVGVTTKGKEFYFDKNDFNLIKNYSWRMHTDGYVVAVINGKNIRMHRLFLPQAEQVDHVNNIRYDNRRRNLRSVTNTQNQMNQLKCKTLKSSRYKGVSWYGSGWRSYIRINHKLIHLGCFTSEEEAALAYNKAASLFFGEFANLNVIEKQYDESVVV
jgi:hypothetical protein